MRERLWRLRRAGGRGSPGAAASPPSPSGAEPGRGVACVPAGGRRGRGGEGREGEGRGGGSPCVRGVGESERCDGSGRPPAEGSSPRVCAGDGGVRAGLRAAAAAAACGGARRATAAPASPLLRASALGAAGAARPGGSPRLPPPRGACAEPPEGRPRGERGGAQPSGAAATPAAEVGKAPVSPAGAPPGRASPGAAGRPAGRVSAGGEGGARRGRVPGGGLPAFSLFRRFRCRRSENYCCYSKGGRGRRGAGDEATAASCRSLSAIALASPRQPAASRSPGPAAAGTALPAPGFSGGASERRDGSAGGGVGGPGGPGRICGAGPGKGVCERRCGPDFAKVPKAGGGERAAAGPTAVPPCEGRVEGDAGPHRRAVPVASRHVRAACARPCPSRLPPPGGRGRRGAHHRGEPVAAKNCGSCLRSWPGSPTRRRPRSAPAVCRLGAGRGPGAEEEEGTRAWARQGHGGTAPGRGREGERRGRRAGPGGSPAAAGGGSRRGPAAAAPLPFSPASLSAAPLTPSAIPSSAPLGSPARPAVLPSFLPSLIPPLPSLPGPPGASSPPCGSLQPDSPPFSWLLLSPLPSRLPSAKSVASRSRKWKGQVAKRGERGRWGEQSVGY